ncbi:MAG: hypothetical protein AAF191_19980, partial [Verrucomicrobiota bacterium]
MKILLLAIYLFLAILFAHLSHPWAKAKLEEELANRVAEAFEFQADGYPLDPRFQQLGYEIINFDCVLTGTVATADTRDEMMDRIREK